MYTRLLEADGERTFVVVLAPGEEVVAHLEAFARQQGIAASRLTAIGVLSKATLGFFDHDTKRYRKTAVPDRVEVLSFRGEITTHEGSPRVHAHVVLGRSNGLTVGGRLLDALVGSTFEAVLTESPPHLARRLDPESDLPLLWP